MNKMKLCLDRIMSDFKLKYKGSISPINSHMSMTKNSIDENSVNLLIIPKANEKNKQENGLFSEFTGTPSFNKSMKHLLREILAVQRNHFTSTPASFTEKKW